MYPARLLASSSYCEQLHSAQLFVAIAAISRHQPTRGQFTLARAAGSTALSQLWFLDLCELAMQLWLSCRFYKAVLLDATNYAAMQLKKLWHSRVAVAAKDTTPTLAHYCKVGSKYQNLQQAVQNPDWTTAWVQKASRRLGAEDPEHFLSHNDNSETPTAHLFPVPNIFIQS